MLKAIPFAAGMVLTSSLLRSLAFAPIGPLLVIALTEADYGAKVSNYMGVAGVVGMMAGYFGGHRVINRLSRVRAFSLITVVSALCAVAYYLLPPPWPWFLVATVLGATQFGCFVVLESWLQSLATSRTRGPVMAVYMMVSFGGGFFGALLVDVFTPGSALPYIYCVGMLVLTPLPLLFIKDGGGAITAPRRPQLPSLWSASPLAMIGSFVSGMMQSPLWALLPVYAYLRPAPVGGPGVVLACFITGCVLGQLPIAYLSNRFGRRPVMFGSFCAASVYAACLAIVGPGSGLAVLVLVALMGSGTSVVYTQSVAHMNDRIADDQRVSALSGMLLVWSLGAFFSPQIVGFAMDYTGPSALPAYIAVVALGAAVFTEYRRRVAAPERAVSLR